MGISPCVNIAVLLACWITNIHSLPLETTIDCRTGHTENLGEINEHYSGDIEMFPTMPDVELQLQVPEDCPKCLDFVEFVFISSITNATVRTKQPLDTEALKETGGVLTYQIVCPGPPKVVNGRVLTVKDVNDNPPIFEKDEYRANGSETATDADLTPANNRISYTIQPPSNTFEVNGLGQILLKERLNYTVTSQYNFTVKAQDSGGLFDETRVIISINKLIPQFEYDHYEASVPENQIGPVTEVLPAPIKASTSEESNYTLIYSISEVSPANYWDSFTVDQNTGVITVVTELDFEEMKDNITLLVKASLEIDRTRTTNTSVTVYVKNVNEAPVFSIKLYPVEIFTLQSSDIQIVQVKATDPDVGESEKLRYSLVEPSSMFTVEPSSGQVYVVSVASGNVTLQVKATDPHGLYDTTTVEVTIKESASRDVVVISLNQEVDTVLNKSLELEEALERALGWSVSIISVSSSSKGLDQSRTTEILPLQREATPRAFVSFIASETNGTDVIPKETVQNKLLDDKETVLEEMKQVFGPSVNFDIVHVSEVLDKTTEIILGTVIPLICIGLIVSAFLIHKKMSSNRHQSDTSSTGKGVNFLDRDTDSMERKPNLDGDTDSMGRKPNLDGDTDSMGGRT